MIIIKTRSAGFLSLASYAKTHDLNSKAKVTAISGKVPENLFGELFHIGGIAPSAAREYTEYIFG